MLLEGYKVSLGDLGNFYCTLSCKGAESAQKFNPANHITSVNVNWEAGAEFTDLRKDAEFNCVATRAAQEATLKAEKAGETTVDLAAAKAKNSATSTTGDAEGGESTNTDTGESSNDGNGNTGTGEGNGDGSGNSNTGDGNGGGDSTGNDEEGFG